MDNLFTELSVRPNDREAIQTLMQALKIKSEATYEHCKRVAVTATKIAEYLKLNPKPAFISGCLHDVGKALIPLHVLHKDGKFTNEDMKIMRSHVIHGYNLTKDIFPFSAEIILRHHRWQKNVYPKKLPKNTVPFSKNTKLLIDYYSRIIALADFYDALNTRNNGKFKDDLRASDMRQIFIDNNIDQKYLIESLYSDKVLN